MVQIYTIVQEIINLLTPGTAELHPKKTADYVPRLGEALPERVQPGPTGGGSHGSQPR